MVTVSPPVSPSVVARILMIQKPSVTAGTLESISPRVIAAASHQWLVTAMGGKRTFACVSHLRKVGRGDHRRDGNEGSGTRTCPQRNRIGGPLPNVCRSDALAVHDRSRHSTVLARGIWSQW